MRVMPRQILIWCCCLVMVQLATALTGDNVCKRVETSSEQVEYVVTEPVTFRVYTWCLKMPPRCSKYTTNLKERIKTKLQVYNHTIDFCCDGYVQLETYCVPECLQTDCPNLVCNESKKCVCKAGFHGQRCHRPCRPGFWGENCASKCVCNGEPCNLISGDCFLTTTISTITTKSNLLLYEPNDNANDFATSIKNKITSQTPTASTILTNAKTKKPEIYQDILQQQESDIDATILPDGMSLDDIQTTLLPEDEVMIVYPSVKTKYDATQKFVKTHLDKTTLTPKAVTISTKKITQKLPTLSPVTKSHNNYERNMKSSTVNYYSKIHDPNVNKNKMIDPYLSHTTEQTKFVSEDNKNKPVLNTNKVISNKKYTSTDLPVPKNIKYHIENTLPKKTNNGLPLSVLDESDNTLQIKNNNFNFTNTGTTADENENHSNIIIKSNDIQRDMEEVRMYNNYNQSNDAAVNSSLMRAKWNSAIEMIDFNSSSVIISITITVLLSLVLIVVIVLHCTKRTKMQTSFYEDNTNVKASPENIVCNGHYASTGGGQPIFFCPAFTNTYAFELAQELREAHYDHPPRSALCLSNEPVYAELQY